MKMQKINKNKIKIFLNSQDLTKNNIDIKSFSVSSNEVKKLVLHICQIAKNTFNFDLNAEKTVIDILPLENDFLIMILSNCKNNIHTSHLSNAVFCFQNPQNFFNFYTEYNNIIKLDKYSLYEYLSKLYIIIPCCDNKLKNKLIEFSELSSSFPYIENILMEYGKKIKTNKY